MTPAKKDAELAIAGTFSEAYADLRRPFTPAAMKFKVQATWNGGAMIVAFLDARLVAGRLNAVCPQLWSSDIQPHPKGGAVCHLTIDGITRSDFGVNEGFENEKGSFSDAFKRAAVHFGVGESVYATPKMNLNPGNLLKDITKDGDRKKKYRLEPAGEKHCRQVYTDWLDMTGKAVYGEPCDHGDIEQVEEQGQTTSEILGDLIGAEAFNPDQTKTIRKWISNGNGKLDPVKADQAIHLLQAKAPETLIERAEAGTEKASAPKAEPVSESNGAIV